MGASPSSENPRIEQTKAAPLFESDATPVTASATDRLVELLSGLVAQPASNGYLPTARSAWDPRKALVCAVEESRESIARSLSENNYQVFVAQDSRQAVERMRENRLDVVVLDSRFDPVEQGPVFVTREVSVLRPAQRRRVFFVLLSPTLRTMDAHAAFLNNVNAVVNVNDLAELPKLIEHRLREFNELYTEFNAAMRLPAL
jgi:CheY-like chemotaxis protein